MKKPPIKTNETPLSLPTWNALVKYEEENPEEKRPVRNGLKVTSGEEPLSLPTTREYIDIFTSERRRLQ